jgi:hypothetical protein
MLRYTGVTADNFYHFTFRTCPTCPGTRLEWPTETNVILLPQDLVTMIQRLRYARPLTGAEVEAYNAAVADAGERDGVSPDPAAAPVPANPETPATGQPVAGEGAPEDPPPAPPEQPPVPPVTEQPPVPPVATDGEQAADGSKTPEQLAAESLLASMDDTSKPKKGK